MFEIKVGGLDHQAVRILLADHLSQMAATSPPESSHALDLDALTDKTVSFWTLWQGRELAGCAALKELTSTHGEVKSMKTAADFVRQGVASRLLQHLIQVARQRGYQRLSLETGSMAYFQPARQLYERVGFGYCEPFADYRKDPNNVFMTLSLL